MSGLAAANTGKRDSTPLLTFQSNSSMLRYDKLVLCACLRCSPQLFGQLNLAEAAAHVSMGETTFKKQRKAFGIQRWPYRWSTDGSRSCCLLLAFLNAFLKGLSVLAGCLHGTSKATHAAALDVLGFLTSVNCAISQTMHVLASNKHSRRFVSHAFVCCLCARREFCSIIRVPGRQHTTSRTHNPVLVGARKAQ